MGIRGDDLPSTGRPAGAGHGKSDRPGWDRREFPAEPPAGDFDVAGFRVRIPTQTVFEGGVAADPGLNVKVEVEGIVDATGTLVASKFDIRRAKAVRIVADLDSVDVAGDSVEVLGITVSIDASPRMENQE